MWNVYNTTTLSIIILMNSQITNMLFEKKSTNIVDVSFLISLFSHQCFAELINFAFFRKNKHTKLMQLIYTYLNIFSYIISC